MAFFTVDVALICQLICMSISSLAFLNMSENCLHCRSILHDLNRKTKVFHCQNNLPKIPYEWVAASNFLRKNIFFLSFFLEISEKKNYHSDLLPISVYGVVVTKQVVLEILRRHSYAFFISCFKPSEASLEIVMSVLKRLSMLPDKAKDHGTIDPFKCHYLP